MKKLISIAAILIIGMAFPAFAQAPICPSVDLTCPAFTYGFVPSPAQWQNWWASRQNTLGYTPLNVAGGTMTGKLATAPSNTANAGLNVPSGTAPSAPVNGDIWTTALGAFWRINGVTVGPINVMSATVGGLVPTPPNSATQFLNGTGVFSTPTGTTAANPTATAGPAAVNCSATTFMRSDAAPAIQKATASVFGLAECGTGITCTAGVITPTNTATTVAGQTCTLGSSCGLSSLSNALVADVLLNNTSNYFTGPTVAQGATGTWCAMGTITVFSPTADAILVKLWDGTTVISSTQIFIPVAGDIMSVSLSGCMSSPAGNLRISALDAASTSGKILFNATANSKDSILTVFRIN